MATEGDGFFSRWSRRKAQAAATPPAAGLPAAETTARVQPSTGVPGQNGLAGAPAVAPGRVAPAVGAGQAVDANHPGQSGAAGGEAPLPTLDDVASLTPESDFKPFVGRAVAPEVKNAAMKKLFADPHFNVMDGLDIYIDDYSKPSPLPAELLKKMVSAQFMKLVDEEPEAPGVPPPGAGSVAVDPGAATAAAGAAAAEPALAAPAPIPATPMPATPDLVTPDKATPVAVETPPATPTPDPS